MKVWDFIQLSKGDYFFNVWYRGEIVCSGFKSDLETEDNCMGAYVSSYTVIDCNTIEIVCI